MRRRCLEARRDCWSSGSREALKFSGNRSFLKRQLEEPKQDRITSRRGGIDESEIMLNERSSIWMLFLLLDIALRRREKDFDEIEQFSRYNEWRGQVPVSIQETSAAAP